MAKVYCYELPNGRVAIVRPTNPFNLDEPELTPAQLARKLQKCAFERTRLPTPQGMNEHFNPADPAHLDRCDTVPMYEVDEADLPASRARRDHWVLNTFAGRNVVVENVLNLAPLLPGFQPSPPRADLTRRPIRP